MAVVDSYRGRVLEIQQILAFRTQNTERTRIARKKLSGSGAPRNISGSKSAGGQLSHFGGVDTSAFSPKSYKRDPRSTKKVVVLFLSSNPIEQTQMELEEQTRAIEIMIRKAGRLSNVSMVSCSCVRPADILKAVEKHQPNIIHFSGPATDSGIIQFEDDNGDILGFKKELLVQVLRAHSDSIRFVFFNEPQARAQAVAAVEHVEASVAMASNSEDSEKLFASYFYSAIDRGNSLQQAFRHARTFLMLGGGEVAPELFVAKRKRAKDVFILWR